MTALTADRATGRRAGGSFVYNAAAAVKCYAGGIAVLDSSGNVKPAVTATGLVSVGRFSETVDNSSGSAGDKTAEVMRGIFKYNNSAAADEITAAESGDFCYLVDDQTVAKTNGTNTRSPAGVIVDVDSDGVWVEIGVHTLISPAAALLAANNFSDIGTAATARANLGVAIGTDVQAYNAKLARVQIQNDLTSRSTNGALATSGVNLITGGTGLSALTIAAPVAGDRCEIRVASLSSGNVVVTCGAGVTLDGTNNTATADAAGEALLLIYHSANRWQIVENVGSVALSSV